MSTSNFLTFSPTRNQISSWLRDSRLAAFIEISIVIMIYILKVRGMLPMSKIPILLVASASLWLRKIGWGQIGLGKPDSWVKTIIAGTVIAFLDTIFGLIIILPLLHTLTGEVMDLQQLEAVRSSVRDLFFWLLLSWPYAALAEEMIYRGYLLNRLADLFGRSNPGWILSLVFSSLMFGYLHGSMGITGILNTALSGVLYAAAYLVFRRNLWVPVIIHGVGNTIGLLIIFFNLYP